MITYIIEGEILNNAQGWYSSIPGIVRWLQAPRSAMGAGERHGMAAVIWALYLKYEHELDWGDWLDLDYIRERFILPGLENLEFDNTCP